MMKTREAEAHREFWIFVKACIGIILVGIAAILLNQPNIGINIVFTGVLMTIFAALFGKEHHFQDERSRRIMEKAGYKTYFATLITIFFIMAFGRIIPLIEKANYFDISGFIFLVGFFCFLLFNWYYNKKGI